MAGRILNFALLLLLGAVFGTVGTVLHQSTLTLAGVALPWGIIVALAAVACLLAGLRLVNLGRAHAFAAAFGLVIMIGIFSLRSTGGSVLIPDNLLGKVWVFAPVIVATIVIAWPRLGDRQRRLGNGIN
ncbi:MAG: N-acetyl-D-myo-inositol-2-amino-2-deoxy-alpha-D-glucopyranoside deacetylase [Microbacteriaceae bacterium]|jgi:N-acetyl-1-D-myo-inositol-2-amino-2-deoxy-alpha-D-glucopyranoside deacetylase|nr:N-acetyl-D-myo-inositol-2-amino-2-deoxy-alpha-D-glucopyranoside deacetylase [Microbacteriaceae bacterium]